MTNTERGLIFAGGGARGAYEAGVLCAVLDRMAQRPGATSIDFVCGTSVGAIHAAVTAHGLDSPAALSRKVAESWFALDMADVVRPGFGTLRRLPSLLIGGDRGAGLLNPTALRNHVARLLPRGGVAEALARGNVRAVTITATHVPTGRPVLFVQRTEGVPLPRSVGRRAIIREVTITRQHVLASAAIPLLFPPVHLDGDLYVDGALRLNTPIGPAVRLGADRVLVVGPAKSTCECDPQLGHGRYPGTAFLGGKMLNAFLIDHVASDLDELERINLTLERGTELNGPDFPERFRELALAHGEPPYHPVIPTVVQPSVDLGSIASMHVRRIRGRNVRSLAARVLLRALDYGEGGAADMASYLLFDGSYARDILELGRADAMAMIDEIDTFLFEPA